MRRILIAFLLLCAASAHADVDPRPRATTAGLQAAVDELRDAYGLPGVAVAVFTEDTLRIFTSGEGITADTAFRLGNTGDVLVATTVLLLERDGSLSLDDAVLTRVPEIDLRNDWYSERPVSVRDLLLHQSGLAPPHYRDIVVANEQQPLLAAINRSFRASQAGFLPGTQTRHSALNTAIAGYIAEQAADASLQEMIGALLNAPLQAGITLGMDTERSNAMAHDRDGRPREALPLNLAAAGDWWASARDLAGFGQLLLNDGRQGERSLLDPELVNLLESAGDRSRWRGHGLLREDVAGIRQFVIRGVTPGFRSSLAYLPERHGGFVVLINQGGDEHALDAFETLLREQLPVVQPAHGLSLPTRLPAKLAGIYLLESQRVAPDRLARLPVDWMWASENEGSLCLSGPGVAPACLQSLEDRQLRQAGSWSASWEWSETDGAMSLRAREQHWLQVAPLELVALLAATWVVLALTITTFVQFVSLPFVAWRFRKREQEWLELLPASLAGLATIAAVTTIVLFYSMNLLQLARPDGMAVTMLSASIAVPLFGTLAIPAYVVAWARKHLHAPVQTGASVLAGVVWTMLFAWFDLVGFQAWNI